MKKVKFAAMRLANVEKQESSTLPDPLLGPQVVRIFSQQVDLERKYCDNILHWFAERTLTQTSSSIFGVSSIAERSSGAGLYPFAWMVEHMMYLIIFKFFLYTFVHCDDTEGLPTKVQH